MTALTLTLSLLACWSPEVAGPVTPPASEPLAVARPAAQALPVVAELTLPVLQESPVGIGIALRHGESLSDLAAWSGLTAEAIAEHNGLDVRATLYPGRELTLPLDAAGGALLTERRDRAAQRRLERWLGTRGGLLGVDRHTVRTGETAWSVARDHGGMPTWVVQAFNSDVDLDRLRIGDTLYLPQLGDLVTAAELGGVVEPVQVEVEPQ